MSNHTDDKRGLGKIVALAAIALLIGFAAVYVTLGWPDNGAVLPAPSAGPAGKGKGLAAFVKKPSPEALADVSFLDGQGAEMKLSAFKGKTVLLNLWATWCAPCRHEMPSLDRLQKALGSDKFEVVALAVDRAGADAARKFLNEQNIEALKLYVDPTVRSGVALKAIGMPTTILIDPEGREIGRLAGPAEWDSPEAKALVESVIK